MTGVSVSGWCPTLNAAVLASTSDHCCQRAGGAVHHPSTRYDTSIAAHVPCSSPSDACSASSSAAFRSRGAVHQVLLYAVTPSNMAR